MSSQKFIQIKFTKNCDYYFVLNERPSDDCTNAIINYSNVDVFANYIQASLQNNKTAIVIDNEKELTIDIKFKNNPSLIQKLLEKFGA